MLRLRFYTPGEGSAESVEPAEFFRVIGSMLCRGSDNAPVATYAKNWRLSDAEFARAESLDPVVIYFENNAGLASSAFGPFDAFHLSDGMAWAGARQLARLDDRTLLWYPSKAQDGWACLLIAPPGKSRFDLTGERPPATGRPEARPDRSASQGLFTGPRAPALQLGPRAPALAAQPQREGSVPGTKD